MSPSDPASWTVDAVLSARAHDRGEHIALRIIDGESLTYAALAERCARTAGALAGLGVQRGERVGVMLGNGTALLETFGGLARLAATHVAINPESSGTFLQHVLALSAVRLLVVDAACVSAVLAVAERLPQLRMLAIDGPCAAVLPASLAAIDFRDRFRATPAPSAGVLPHEIACIMFTSGTTGPAKAVLMPHAHCHLFGQGSIAHMGLGADDAFYVVLPLFHANGLLMQVYASWIAGASAMVRSRFSASAWVRDLHATPATHTNLLGVTASFALAQAASARDHGHRLRCIGLAPNPPGMAGTLRARFGVDEVIGMYGMTEVNIPLWAPRGGGKDGSCGHAWESHFEVRIVDPDTDAERPRGEVGEIVVRPKHPFGFMAGYLGMPEQTVAAWRNLWFHTGDAARMDADGEVYFVDRIKDCIRRRGENISSLHIEQVMADCPGVAEVAAVAVPSALAGGEDELLLAVVSCAGAPVESAHVSAFAARELPRYAQPDRIVLLDALPKTSTGKVRKQQLRALAGGAPGGKKPDATLSSPHERD